MSTESDILKYLSIHSTATAKSIALAFSETPANIRYHLTRLIRIGQVEAFHIPSTRKSNPRGRPVLHYRLTGSGKPDGVQELVDAVLDAWYSRQTDPLQRQYILEAIAIRLFQTLPSSSNIPARLNDLAAAMNHLAYQARWEAHHDGARLFLGNCPYARILAQHPELCEMDRLSIENASQMQAAQVARFDRVTGPPFACQFHLAVRLRPQDSPSGQSYDTINGNLIGKSGD